MEAVAEDDVLKSVVKSTRPFPQATDAISEARPKVRVQWVFN